MVAHGLILRKIGTKNENPSKLSYWFEDGPALTCVQFWTWKSTLHLIENYFVITCFKLVAHGLILRKTGTKIEIPSTLSDWFEKGPA